MSHSYTIPVHETYAVPSGTRAHSLYTSSSSGLLSKTLTGYVEYCRLLRHGQLYSKGCAYRATVESESDARFWQRLVVTFLYCFCGTLPTACFIHHGRIRISPIPSMPRGCSSACLPWYALRLTCHSDKNVGATACLSFIASGC